MKRIITSLTLVLAIWSSVYALTPVLAKPVASVDRIYQYVMSKNPGSSFTYEMAKAYYDTGNRWGIRGDIAVCQAAIETGWFRYEGGTAVTPDDHNYCGLGVTTKGQYDAARHRRPSPASLVVCHDSASPFGVDKG